MSFCDHCAGQRFDRARLLRLLREERRRLRQQGAPRAAEQALAAAMEAIRALDVPHLDTLDDIVVDGEIVH